jgi:hypothetical protein
MATVPSNRTFSALLASIEVCPRALPEATKVHIAIARITAVRCFFTIYFLSSQKDAEQGSFQIPLA